MFRFTRDDLPPGFRFGTATSSYQIEGHASGDAGATHWDDFAATPGNVVRYEHGGRACDHYHRFEADLDLVRDAGLDAYRFSTSWARVLPDGRGTPNAKGLDFYDRLVDAMCARGLEPWLTLYHWELPSPLADSGGWRNRDIAERFADYANVVVGRLGDRLHAVAPINEPWCVAWLSHYLGLHAPGVRDVRAAVRAMHHVGLAHGRAIEAMRAAGQDNLGLVVNFEYAEPADESPAAAEAARLYDGIYNRWFLGGTRHGRYPQDIVDVFGRWLPAGWVADLEKISQPVDWIGINYYTRKLVTREPNTPTPDFIESVGDRPTTTMGWEIYPEGLAFFLDRVHRDDARALPIYVTENGMSAVETPSGDGYDDTGRIDFVDRHVAVVREAIARGVDVRGYFIWSLLDNYEWALGYDKRFGLVHVDYDTLERTPKRSWHALGEALARR